VIHENIFWNLCVFVVEFPWNYPEGMKKKREYRVFHDYVCRESEVEKSNGLLSMEGMKKKHG